MSVVLHPYRIINMKLIRVIISHIQDLVLECIAIHITILRGIIILITTLTNIMYRRQNIETLSRLLPGSIINSRTYLLKSLALICLLLNFSCAERHNYGDDGAKSGYLYDKVGFDIGGAPKGQMNPEPAISAVAPDYYYRQPAYQSQSYNSLDPRFAQAQQPYGVQQPYQGQVRQQPVQPYYQQQPQQQPRAVHYQMQQSAPGSRLYSDPYAIPPAPQAPRYDADQFYTPPSYQNNMEQQQPLRNNGAGSY